VPRGRVSPSAATFMLASLADAPPERPGWLFEIKAQATGVRDRGLHTPAGHAPVLRRASSGGLHRGATPTWARWERGSTPRRSRPSMPPSSLCAARPRPSRWAGRKGGALLGRAETHRGSSLHRLDRRGCGAASHLHQPARGQGARDRGARRLAGCSPRAICLVGALGRALNVQPVCLARGRRARSRKWGTRPARYYDRQRLRSGIETRFLLGGAGSSCEERRQGATKRPAAARPIRDAAGAEGAGVCPY
jgi:hypothetical protein